MRHIIAGTLYTNGMRYYQIKDSLDPARQITLSKSSGKYYLVEFISFIFK